MRVDLAAIKAGFNTLGYSALYSSAVRQVEEFPSSGSDDTVQLQNALTWLGAGARRTLMAQPSKLYTISAPLSLVGALYFNFDGQGATIKAANGMTTAENNQVLYMQNCKVGLVNDLFTDGNRAGRTPQEADNHNVQIYDSCASLKFVRVQADNGCCDGFYLGTSTPNTLATLPTDIEFHECGATNAYRNCMSLINTNRFRDFGGTYNGATGTAPQSGIDVEPNGDLGTGDNGNIDARFYGTTTNNNVGIGFQGWLKNNEIKAFDLTSSFNGGGAVGGYWGTLELRGLIAEGYTSSVARGIVDVGDQAGRTFIDDVNLINCLTGSDAKPGIYTHATSLGPTSIRNVRAIGCNMTTVQANNKLIMDGLDVDGGTAGYALVVNSGAAKSQVSKIRGRGVGLGFYVNAADVSVSDVRLDNPTGTAVLNLFDTSATRPSLSDYEVSQTTAIPAGQIGVRFNTVPARVTGVLGRCGGTAWTESQLCVFNAGTTGSLLSAISPSSLYGTVTGGGTVTQTPKASALYNFKKTNTSKLSAIIGRGGSSLSVDRGRIVIIGDSYSAGYAAGNGDNFANGRKNCYSSQLATLLTQRGVNAAANWTMGDAFSGDTATLAGYDPRLTFTGCSILTGFDAIGGNMIQLGTTTDKMTFTPGGTFDTIEILVACNNQAGVSGNFDVLLNGSATVSSTQTSNDILGMKKITLTVANTTTAVSVRGKTNSTFIAGIGTRMSTAKGVEIINGAATGQKLQVQAFAPTSNGDAETWNNRAASTALMDTNALHCTVINGWYNDWSNGRTIAQMQADLQTLITFYKALGDVIFLGYVPLIASNIPLATFNAWQSAAYATCLTNDIPYIDPPSQLVDFTTLNGYGLYGDNSLHFGSDGHHIIARMLLGAIDTCV
jgi:lysophospholipase L1-like esterase